MAWWLQLAWYILFGLMLVIAIGGNSIVMWIVLAHRRMRTVTNYFLVNLSLADLLMSVFNCIFNFIYMINNDWQFGRSYCTINNFVANVTVAASVFTLTGISCDRYLAIIRPLKPRMSKFNAHVTILIIWLASLLLGFPCLLFSTTITYKKSGQTACILLWPDGHSMVSTLDYVYTLVLFFVTYVLPMAAMVGCYSAMGRELWGSRAIGVLTQRQVDSIKSKRKVVRMFIIIVSIFGICWLPYHSYFLYTHHNTSLPYTSYVQHLYLSFYWLAMSNAMVNPLIYYWMNARFRQYFRTAVCEWKICQRRVSRMEGTETPPMIRHYSHSYSRSRSGTDNDCSERGRNVRSMKLTPGIQTTNNCTCNPGHPPYTLSCCSQQRPPYIHNWRLKNNSYFYGHKTDLGQHVHINSSQV
ncbi:tachykinin-like peptides receptor 86C [Lycorma delicatula]|uniref:tachykinin-like peptides receptor 86C n=1 Tax=Lycorma delicatula TaxID=130591 RepID=UPI003F514D55